MKREEVITGGDASAMAFVRHGGRCLLVFGVVDGVVVAATIRDDGALSSIFYFLSGASISS
jgi:hypothetical protein